ncbi:MULTISPECIES: hypothetical protein [unclassified Bradyrhizobium]|uniref:hypothetical protein n=1 Tax=unclassified Bradyrhizobium TaxID=2631580 RepID=UPI00247B1365|nr:MULTISPECIES: hypothetical protein [unclassified Bradyrhizobium]WGR70930.1 hypothetical protein MTX24_37440 [Bradyrhizobium sp. ISRA426]WGR75768.1 hypothetical protein MTX21_22545 [Bradyrhizobium sp. ISRA430]WGR86171.1 hypothetical protein MTX25_37130 [Bradyrhizobium sp. ISRA432]
MSAALSWLARCAVVAAALLLACQVATAWIGTALQQPAVTTRDGSLITLNRYIQEPLPDVVLVGSSVTWRLKEEYFAHPRVRNLGLAGGSPLTGLEIVAKQRRLPRIVLIETNVLSRRVDNALVQKFSGGVRPDALFLRPIRTVIAAYESWRHASPSPAQVHAELEQVLRQPPATFDNTAYADRALEQMNAEDPTLATRDNVALIKELIADIERRGARALLIEVPYSPEIEGSRFARITKDIVHGAFPDSHRWLPIDPPHVDLRWADGIHLDERSALLVVRAIEKALAERGERPS